jgi:hypothetical protein
MESSTNSLQDEAKLWKTAQDPKSGRIYYYHIETRETQWRKPICLSSDQERLDNVAKEQMQREFFAAMEANIFKSIGEGKAYQDKEHLKSDAVLASSSTEEIPLQKFQKPRLIRTISSMDESILTDLVKRLPSVRNDASLRWSDSSAESSTSMSVVLGRGNRLRTSSMLSIKEGESSGDEVEDELADLNRSKMLVMDHFYGLQESEALEGDDIEDGSSMGITALPGESATTLNSSENDAQWSLTNSTATVQSALPSERRSDDAESSESSHTEQPPLNNSATTGSLSPSQLKPAIRPGRHSDFRLSAGAISLGFDEEETRALRALADMADEMAEGGDEEDDGDGELAGISIVNVDQKSSLYRAISSMSDGQYDGGCVSAPRNDSSPVVPPLISSQESDSMQLMPLPKPFGIGKTQRRNTCSTVYVGSTMSAPDVEAQIKCVCATYRAHILQSSYEDNDDVDGEYAIFNDQVSDRGCFLGLCKSDEATHSDAHVSCITLDGIAATRITRPIR